MASSAKMKDAKLEHHGLDSSMHIVRATKSTRALSPIAQLSHDVLAADLQAKSTFFSKLPQEIRNMIYGLVLTASSTSDGFVDGATCECVSCQYRRWEDSRGGCLSRFVPKGARSPVIRSRTSSIVHFFQTCRRIYDESRPFLQECNEFWFDGKLQRFPIMRAMAKALSTHRGIPLTTSILQSATFIFGLVSHSFSGINMFRQFYKAFASSRRSCSHSLRIQHITIIFKLIHGHVTLDFIPLLRTLEIMDEVRSCKVEFQLPDETESPDSDREIQLQALQSIAHELEQAALCDPSHVSLMSRTAASHFLHANTLLLDEPIPPDPKKSSIIQPCPANYADEEIKKWDTGFYDLPDISQLEYYYGFNDFMAVDRAKSIARTQLDPRAMAFVKGAMGYQTREALVYES